MDKFVGQAADIIGKSASIRETMISVRSMMEMVQHRFSVAINLNSDYFQTLIDQIRLKNYVGCLVVLFYAPLCLVISVGVTEGAIIPKKQHEMNQIAQSVLHGTDQFNLLEAHASNMTKDIANRMESLHAVRDTVALYPDYLFDNFILDPVSLLPQLAVVYQEIAAVLSSFAHQFRQVEYTPMLALPCHH
mmetsp:Transcript_6223/g.9824  ORF Transcript_6223/g.9824 Transcript_6223/m.9824 type:complete len:190 (-) Transcript_6223:93-662(-)